jgi:hypothetical protein
MVERSYMSDTSMKKQISVDINTEIKMFVFIITNKSKLEAPLVKIIAMLSFFINSKS